MKAFALALFLCAALPQDREELTRKIEEILPKLSDDSIDVRDGAVRSLAELGPAALPLLRKRAGELGGETRGRLLEACARIESQNTLGKYLPPLKKVTLDWDNRPAREALEEISRRTGIAIDGANVNADGAVSFVLKDAPPIQAIDEVCRKAGLAWRNGDDEMFSGRRRAPAPTTGPRVLLQNGKSIDYPVSYLRHYRFRITQVSLTRTNNFQANQSNAQMNLDFGWAPDVRPDGLASFKITELKDEQGRSLLMDENERFRGRMGRIRSRYRGRDMSYYSQYLAFKFPEADAKKIASLKGIAVFSYPQETKTVQFEKPAESLGKAIELGGLTITLKEYQDKGTGHSVTLEMAGKYQPDAPADEFDDQGGLPFSYEDVDLVNEAGESLRHQGMSGRGDGKTYTWTLDFEGEKASPAKEIRIFCVLRRFLDEAAFEIRDIALPK